MKPANDKGPPRYVACRSVDVRHLAEHFGVDEDRMRAFCLAHELELEELLHRSALDFVEEFGLLEGLIPQAASEPPEDWELCTIGCPQTPSYNK